MPLKKRLAAYGLLAVLSAAAVLGCHWLTQVTHREEVTVYSLPDDAVSVLDSVSLQPANARLDAPYGFRPLRSDAQLTIAGIGQSARTFCVRLASPLPAGTACQLYYAQPGEIPVEANSKAMLLEVDTDQVLFVLPRASVYETFRLDIDAAYDIRDILVSPTPAEAIRLQYAQEKAAGHITPPWGQMALGFALFFFVGAAIIHGKRTKR